MKTGTTKEKSLLGVADLPWVAYRTPNGCPWEDHALAPPLLRNETSWTDSVPWFQGLSLSCCSITAFTQLQTFGSTSCLSLPVPYLIFGQIWAHGYLVPCLNMVWTHSLAPMSLATPPSKLWCPVHPLDSILPNKSKANSLNCPKRTASVNRDRLSDAYVRNSSKFSIGQSRGLCLAYSTHPSWPSYDSAPRYLRSEAPLLGTSLVPMARGRKHDAVQMSS